MSDDFTLRTHIEGKSLDELLEHLVVTGALPGSPVRELVITAIQVEVARQAREVGRGAVRWAKVQGVATAIATLIAVVALLT
jgi:hypothetical protein